VRRSVRKQGSYEQAVETTRNAEVAISQMRGSTSSRMHKQGRRMEPNWRGERERERE
jgi:hypothetical protein